MKDLRTLCDEAIQFWDADCDMDGIINEMRAHLAQPAQPGPTDEELIQLAIDTRLYRFQATAGDPVQYEMTEQQVHAFARAVLKRWGAPSDHH
jgi:hypothetical protein